MTKNKKLYRSIDNKMLAGICGGIGEYLEIDPTVIRVLFVLFMVLSAVIPFVILYLLLIIIMPENPGDN